MTENESTPPASRRARRWIPIVAVAAVTVLIAAFVVLGVSASVGAQTAARSDDLPPGMNAPTAGLLTVDPLHGARAVREPAYSLTNEDGSPLSPDRFRGKTVILTFNDDECTDLCALFAQDVVAADRDLSAAARAHVAFVSVNANPYYPTRADVTAWSAQHGLTALHNWYYGTGSPAALAQVAKAFDVPIQLDPATRSVEHGTQIFVISPEEREVYLAQFGSEDADTAPFAHGLALLAADALPASQRGRVAGPNLPAVLAGGTDVGDTPSPLTGANLAVGGAALSTASDHGHYTVVEFWSSTCVACATQLPAIEAEHRSLGAAVDVLGVDVSDGASAGRAKAARYGLTFPVVSDGDGTQAARFRVSQLPFTVILSPDGKVLVRHPGVFTQPELDYVLHDLDQNLPGGSD